MDSNEPKTEEEVDENENENDENENDNNNLNIGGSSDDGGDTDSNSTGTPKESPRGRDEPPVDPAVICQACLIGDVDEVRNCLQNPASANVVDPDGRTPLHAAAYSDEPQIVQMLIAAGSLVNAKDRFLLTPLHRACSSRAHEVVSQLIASGADINRKDKFWQTPLHIAASSGAITCARFLLKAGALADERDCHGRTALHLAASLSVRISSHSEAAGDICKLLIEKGRASLTVRDNFGRHPIHYAAASGNTSTFKVLSDAGAKLDVTDSELFMPIHCACVSGSSSILGQIIRAGLLTQPTFSHQIDAIAAGDQSPLHLAAAGGFIDCVQILLANGADPDLLNAAGLTPIHYAAAASKGYDSMMLLLKGTSQPHKLACLPDSNGRTACHYAAYFGNLERLKSLLRVSLDGSENCTCPDDVVCSHRRRLAQLPDLYGLQALHYAAAQGHTAICKLLIKFQSLDVGNNNEAKSSTTNVGPLARAGSDCWQVFPLLLAAASGSVDCTRVLMSALSTSVKNLDTFTDSTGRNCFHAACYSGSPDTVSLLATSNMFADFNRQCGQIHGWTPLHFVAAARRRRYGAEVVKVLMTQAGDLIDPNVTDKLGRTALMVAAAMDDSSGSVFNSLISFANADPLIVDNEARSLLHYASGNSNGSQGRSSGSTFERSAISRVLASPEVASRNEQQQQLSPSSSSPLSLLSPADAGELVDMSLVGPQTNPLHIACFHGLAANLAALVPLMPSLLSSADEYGWTPLHYAAALKSPEAAADCVQLLLAGGANVVAKECKYGFTPLHVAAYFGVASTVRILVDYVTSASENQLGSTLSATRRPLLPEPQTFINCRDRYLRTPLHLAITSRHRESVCVLLHRGADFRARDAKKRSALHRAAFIGDTELVQWLSKAEPQGLLVKDSNLGRNVLHLAVSCGNIEVVDVLASACPRLILSYDSDGISPLHLAAWRKGNFLSSVSFGSHDDDAILKGLLALLQPEWIEKLLKSYQGKLSPFHCAALADRAAALEKLKEAFFKTEPVTLLEKFVDSRGRNLFHAAFSSGSIGVFHHLVDWLKLATCSQMLSVRCKSRRSWTPAQYAASHGRVSILRACRELLGDPGIVDLLEPKILHLAAKRGHEATAMFLLEAYCKVESRQRALDWVEGVISIAIKKGLVLLTEALLNIGVNPLGSAGSKSRPAVFAVCSTENQMTCLAMAIARCKSKECWDLASGSHMAESNDDDACISDEAINVEVLDGCFSPSSSSKNKQTDSGLAESSGRKSSASAFSDDGDFF